MNALTKTEAGRAPKPALATGNAVAAMVPNSIESAWRLSEVIAASGMAPKTYGQDANKIMVGMLAGMEIGLTPFAALQSIAVINGNPSLWGDGALALVLASNLVEDMSETDDGDTATCTIKRTGRATPIIRTFSNDDAKRAGLLGKPGPWQQYPARMRQLRARSFALRDGFPDVLKGLRIAEEVRDYQDIGPAAAMPAAAVSVPRLTGAALLEQAEAEPVAAPADDVTQQEPQPVTVAAEPAQPDDTDRAKWQAWTAEVIAGIPNLDRNQLAKWQVKRAADLEYVAATYPKMHEDIQAMIADRNAALDGEVA